MFLFWSASNPLIHVECKRTVNFCIFFYIYFFADFQLEMFCLLFLATSSSGARCAHGTRCLPYWRLFFLMQPFLRRALRYCLNWILRTLATFSHIFLCSHSTGALAPFNFFPDHANSLLFYFWFVEWSSVMWIYLMESGFFSWLMTSWGFNHFFKTLLNSK